MYMKKRPGEGTKVKLPMPPDERLGRRVDWPRPGQPEVPQK